MRARRRASARHLDEQIQEHMATEQLSISVRAAVPISFSLRPPFDYDRPMRGPLDIFSNVF